MKMTIKIAFAVIYYVALSFTLFEDTFADFGMIASEEERNRSPWLEDIFNAMGYEDNILTNLLIHCRDMIGLNEKNVPCYADVLNELNGDRITLPIVKDAGKTLIRAMDLKKEDMDEIGYLFD